MSTVLECLKRDIEEHLGGSPPQLEALLRPYLHFYTLSDKQQTELAVLLTPPNLLAAARETDSKPLLDSVLQPLIKLFQHYWPQVAMEIGTKHPAQDFDLIVYHGNCPDGLSAAWCFWRYNRQVETVGMTYGKPPPDVKGRRVAIVDFSFPREVMEQMYKDAAYLHVWDHHETSQEALVGLDYCTFDMSKAGCELAWEALEGDKPKPYWLQANGDHDVWRKVPDSEALSRVLREKKANNFAYYDTLEAKPELREELLKEGYRLLEQDEKAMKRQLKFCCLFKLKGTDYIVRVGVPPPALRSEFGEYMCLAGGCDFSLSYIYALNKGEWWLSARSLKNGGMNVAQLMKETFGGGGHPNAAGATLYEREKGQTFSQYFEPYVVPTEVPREALEGLVIE